MRPQFGKQYIDDEFTRIGITLEHPLTVYLIGGGALSFRDLKDATKDIDVIVARDHDLVRLQETLGELDYEPVRDPDAEYEELGATAIMENSDNCRFDIFNQQVVDKLIFSDGMESRSTELDTYGNLTVNTASMEDIFLFKSVAGRAGDIEDMNTLVQTGLDFPVILEELQGQTELLNEELFVTHVNEALIDLEDRFNVTTPIADDIERLSHEVYDQLAILNSFTDTTTIEEIHSSTELSRDRVAEMLTRLEEKNSIARNQDRIQKVRDRV